MATGESEITELVRDRYGKAALQAKEGKAGCCGPSPSACGCGCGDPISGDLYQDQETAGLPRAAVMASLG